MPLCPRPPRSECNAKVEALRRTALQTLPPMLIIHLKRFEFNLETMTKFKVRTGSIGPPPWETGDHRLGPRASR